MTTDRNFSEKENPLDKFLQSCDLFYESIKEKKIKKATRGQENLPALKYNTKGNYTYIQNHQAFLNYCNRTLAQLIRFFSERLGCTIENIKNTIRTRGAIKMSTLKQAEKQFYLKEVLCVYCSSPETVRSEDAIICANCNKTKPL